MISIRNKGAHIPELAGKFLGNVSKHVVNIFALLLLLLVGTVFVTTPASLLSILLNGKLTVGIIIALIFAYYFLSTILPIDKIIGRFYPYFGAILLLGTLGVDRKSTRLNSSHVAISYAVFCSNNKNYHN